MSNVIGANMKVMKFGGSTIKNPDMMKEVARIIAAEIQKKAIVVSALHRQTNEIREFLAHVKTEHNEISAFVKKILNKHEFMSKNAISSKEILDDVHYDINNYILKMERLLYGVAYTEELTPRTKDLIMSSAERLSTHIVVGVLKDQGISAEALEADKIGVVTDGRFCEATADLKRCQENLQKVIIPRIEEGIVPVITGFFGCDKEGRTTTFGKNGSDYSAAVIAYSLDAECLELWKDVDGFMSADPYLIPEARTIDVLSYDEAAELAYFGNDILHPRTVGPVRIKKIPILIKNIKNPRSQGTIICNDSNEDSEGIKSVAYSTDLVEIRISGSWAGLKSGTLADVTGILGQKGINIFSVATSHTHLSVLIYKDDLNQCLSALKSVSGGIIEGITYLENIALVCAVGEGSRRKVGLASKIFSAVADAYVNVEIISAGASDVAAHFVIKEDNLKKTLEAIHSAFIIN
jgi:aspartate kinase